MLPAEIRKKDHWAAKHLLKEKAKMPFSFVYGGKASDRLLPGWTRTTDLRTLDDNRTQHTLVWRDAKTGLEIRCVAVDYADVDTYHFRSNMSASMTLAFDMRRTDLNYKLASRLFAQLKEISPDYLGDFYPLTDYTLNNGVWMAWQYDRPDAGRGMVQAFRRQQNADSSKVFRLQGLVPSAQYEVTNFDVEGTTKIPGGSTPLTTGRDLMENGLTVEIKDKPGAAVIAYQRAKREIETL
ncbi:GH36 C-terminal domain-containing protein [Verrucomicrobiota bacterium]